MAQKRETVFRSGHVIPFLKTLAHTVAFPVQQRAIRGSPDFLVCCGGIFVGLELKAENGSLDLLQKYNLEKIEKCGGVAIVASPTNWEEVKALLIKLDQGEKS